MFYIKRYIMLVFKKKTLKMYLQVEGEIIGDWIKERHVTTKMHVIEKFQQSQSTSAVHIIWDQSWPNLSCISNGRECQKIFSKYVKFSTSFCRTSKACVGGAHSHILKHVRLNSRVLVDKKLPKPAKSTLIDIDIHMWVRENGWPKCTDTQ